MIRNTHNLDDDNSYDHHFTDRLDVWIVAVVGFIVAAIILAPKAAVGLLIAFALLGLVSLWQRPQRLGALLAVPGLPLMLSFAAFVIWIILSTGWHFSADGEAAQALKIAVLFSIGFAALMVPLPSDMKLWRAIGYGFCGGYIFTCVLIATAILYIASGHEVFWGSYYDDPLSTLNNHTVMIVLMFWPALLFLRGTRRVWRIFLFLLVLGILSFSSSLASVVAILVCGIGMAFRYFSGRNAAIGLALLVAAATVSAPYGLRVIDADRFASSEMVMDDTRLLPASARHRLAMWAFATEKIAEKPWLGWGFGASRHIPQEDRRLAPNMEIMPLHPHNLALQTRLELGLPGVLILASLVFAVFYRLATFTDDGWKSGIAMAPAAGWFFVANVSYGMWQSWWIATAFLLAVVMRLAMAGPVSEGINAADKSIG